MQKKKIYLAAAITVAIVVFSLLGKNFVYKSYIKLFRISTIIEHRNNKGNLDGEYAAYVDGKIYGRSYFENGLREGWCIWYNEKTGNKKQETFYRKGQSNGVQNVYYDNGKLNYTVHLKNDKYDQYGYHYSEDGTLTDYNAFDKSKGENNGYCFITYDSAGKFHQILGNVFSKFIYSTCKDSIVPLVNTGKYNCINDLFLSVATPPQLKASVSVTINSINYDKISVNNNTALIAGAFKKAGTYQFKVIGILKTENGKIVKTDSLKAEIVKD